MNKEEAIKIVRSHYPANKQMLNEALEFLIPELKEDENEKIRKEIISVFKGQIAFTSEEDAKKYIAWLEKQVSPEDKGEISDGYHTFNELYYYRMLYNAAFFNSLPKALVHKSKKHHDGEECFGGGWFIVMANLPTGQISNHYELKDWELFQIPEKEVADEWDGHTPKEAAERLHKYLLEKLKTDKVESFNKYEGLTDFERALADICISWIGEEPGWKQYIKDNADVLLKIAIKKFNSVQDVPFEQKPIERKDYISIPFGAFDSELIEETITIPDGYYAYITGNKIYIHKNEQKQDPCKNCDHPMLNCHYFPCATKKAFEQNNLVTTK